MKKSVAITCAVASFICGLFVVISLVTPVWLKSTIYFIVKEIITTYGLFQYCKYDLFGVWVCLSQTYTSDSMHVVRAFLIMASILLFSQIIYCGMVAKEKAHCRGISILFLLAGFFILIALATYTANIANGTSYSYGYSYYLGWVSMVGAVAMAVISAVMARVSDYLVLA